MARGILFVKNYVFGCFVKNYVLCAYKLLRNIFLLLARIIFNFLVLAVRGQGNPRLYPLLAKGDGGGHGVPRAALAGSDMLWAGGKRAREAPDPAPCR